MFARARIDGWAFDAEALALARALGYRCEPCGIAWMHRPGSRLSMRRIVIPVLRELVAARAHVRETALQSARDAVAAPPLPAAPQRHHQ